MATKPRDAVHEVHTATNDVLEGYKSMLERAEPEIIAVIADLTALHKRHAEAQSQRLQVLGQDDTGDTSFRGTINAAFVTIRDWLPGWTKVRSMP